MKHWRTRPAKSITRRDSALLPDKVVDRNAPVMANRVGALLSQMFRFGVTRGMLEASPFVALGRPGGSEKARNRRLSDKEIRIFWKKLTRARLSAEVRLALKLMYSDDYSGKAQVRGAADGYGDALTAARLRSS